MDTINTADTIENTSLIHKKISIFGRQNNYCPFNKKLFYNGDLKTNALI